jgi:mono/diheme cytochrome c family protein
MKWINPKLKVKAKGLGVLNFTPLVLLFQLFTLLVILLLGNACESHPYQQGEILYNNFCANCHMENGAGLGQLIPTLVQSDYLKNNQSALACIIRKGLEGEIIVNGKSYNQAMPGVPQLNDVEITNVINYINHAWENDYPIMQLQDVQKALEGCIDIPIQ